MFVLIGRFQPFVTTEYVHVFVGGSGLLCHIPSLAEKGPSIKYPPIPHYCFNFLRRSKYRLDTEAKESTVFRIPEDVYKTRGRYPEGFMTSEGILNTVDPIG